MPQNRPLTAQELISKSVVRRRMVPAPDAFSGSIEDLASNHVVPNLIAPRVVAKFHKLLLDYIKGSDPLFLIRALGETIRGQIYHTNDGERFKAADNAPAWWIHFVLFNEIVIPASSFASIIETLPTHFFEVAAQVPHSISSAGWHVAHIFPVKDHNTNYRTWDHNELARRCVLNIHPCNYFFIPKTDWQVWGGNEHVISYFAELYEGYYRSVWADFVSLAGTGSKALAKSSGPVAYAIAPRPAVSAPIAVEQSEGASLHQQGGRVHVLTYEATRLAFKADLIEPLHTSGRFRIVTPVGTFEMSKAEFYSAFPNVVKSKSYKEGRLYHYPTVPRVAQRFRTDG